MEKKINITCNDTELSSQEIDFIDSLISLVETYGNLSTGIIGVVLNFITIIVLSSSKMRNNVFNRLLICLAVFDNSYLFCEISEVFRVWNQTYLQQYVFAKFVYPVRSVFMSSSIYMNIVLASERYQALTSPVTYRVKRTSNMSKQVLTSIMPVLVVSFIYYTPKFFDINVEETVECNNNNSSTNTLEIARLEKEMMNCTLKYYLVPTELRINHHYLLWYLNISNLLITAIVPICILVYLNIRIYMSLDKFLQRRPSTNSRLFEPERRLSFHRQQSVDVKKTFILFSIVVILIVCHSLRFILNMEELLRLSLSNEELQDGCEPPHYWEQILIPLSQLLLIMNASVHFFIYGFFDKEFQQVLKGICIK